MGLVILSVPFSIFRIVFRFFLETLFQGAIILFMKKTSVNLLEGPILRAMIAFAIPIMIANIFQQLYNTVDIMIVGRFLGEESLAAVGATAAIFELVVGFALGIGNGMGIVIARYYGAGNYEKLKSAVAATFVIGGVLSIVIALLGNFTLYPLLKLLGTPSNIIDQSYEYSYLIVVFVGVTLAYNLCAGLLRAVGDSKAALYFLIFSAIIVVALFLFLQYNRLIFASVEAYVAPGNSNAAQTIYSPNSSNSVGQEPKLIIPKINVDVPVVYGVGNDNASQLKAMEKGVAHFSIPGANAVPGQNGNTVLSGHSSNDLFDTGDYKFIFAQLDKLKQGDVIYANYNGKRYTYNVTKTEVVMPNQVNRVQIGTDKPMLTLITCVPLGTAEKRLLVFAEQVSPDPTKAEKPAAQENSDNKKVTLPRNSLTFFERLFSWKWD